MTIQNCSDKSNLPDLGFMFKGYSQNGKDSAFELILTPDDYVLEFEVNGKNDCVVGIGSDNEDSGWTLGQVFLKAYYTVFDRENEVIGFVKSNPYPHEVVIKNDNSQEAKKINISNDLNNNNNNKSEIEDAKKVNNTIIDNISNNIRKNNLNNNEANYNNLLNANFNNNKNNNNLNNNNLVDNSSNYMNFLKSYSNIQNNKNFYSNANTIDINNNEDNSYKHNNFNIQNNQNQKKDIKNLDYNTNINNGLLEAIDLSNNYVDIITPDY